MSFQGITGLIDFYDASATTDRLFDGDRRNGVVYNLVNYAGGVEELRKVATWTSCDTCPWAERFQTRDGVEMTFSTSDNTLPLEADPPDRTSIVRIGVLLPMFSTGKILQSWSPRVGVLMAIQEINNKSDGQADLLLPRTQIKVAYRDSRCDRTSAHTGALSVMWNAFAGLGVSAIVGAGCSSASLSATLAASAPHHTHSPPLFISPSAISTQLSSSYPFFSRTILTDALESAAMLDVLIGYMNITKVALVTATDAYSTTIRRAFIEGAVLAGVVIYASATFEPSAVLFTDVLTELKNANVGVLALVAQEDAAVRFMTAAYEFGIGGEGLNILLSCVVSSGMWTNQPHLASNPRLRLAVLKGMIGLQPGADETSERYASYELRKAAYMRSINGGPGCNLQLDDDGTTYLWAQDTDKNASSPLECAGAGHSAWDAYGYDAVYAVAYALHDLIEVQKKTTVVGGEVYTSLVERVSFDGVTGQVNLWDVSSSGESSLYSHGDRPSGASYRVVNYAGATLRTAPHHTTPQRTTAQHTALPRFSPA